MSDEERRFWEFANQCAAEVAKWPNTWRGGLYPEGPQFKLRGPAVPCICPNCGANGYRGERHLPGCDIGDAT